MRFFIAIILSCLLLTGCASSKLIKNSPDQIAPGEKFRISGCENGKLLTPLVNLWDKPGNLYDSAKIIGQLSGDGRKELGLECQGSVVKLIEKQKINGRTFLYVESIINGKKGWITDSFIGKKE